VLVSTSRGPPWRCSQSGSLRSSPPRSSSATTSLRRPRPGAGSIPTLWPSCSPSTPRLPRCPQSVPRSVMGISRR
jgi:hypothetical protein